MHHKYLEHVILDTHINLPNNNAYKKKYDADYGEGKYLEYARDFKSSELLVYHLLGLIILLVKPGHPALC